MKKNKSVLLSLIIFSFIFPFFVFAAPAINLGFFSENANSQTGKLDLWLKVNTTDVPNGTIIAVDLFKNGVKDGPTINVPITNNYGEYRSGSVLDPATKYSVIATALGATTTFERTTAGNPVLGVDPPVTVTGIGTTATDSTTYKLLAPIGGLEFAPNNIGEYFNKIFLIAIGLCGALAVIMIVIGGVQYMGDESIFGKTEAKSRIMSAILGLLIALGAYVLLNTINPDLLGKNGINIQQVSAQITPLYDRGSNDPKQPNGESTRCVPLASGPCSVASLTIALGVDTATATAMSKICNMESGGTSVQSGTDICKPSNTAFSFGLFQVNLASNGILAGTDCANLFDRKVSSQDAIVPKYTSGFTCSLLPGKETLYNTCKNRLLDAATNLAIAKSLLAASPSKSPWVGDKKYCASAFN